MVIKVCDYQKFIIDKLYIYNYLDAYVYVCTYIHRWYTVLILNSAK